MEDVRNEQLSSFFSSKDLHINSATLLSDTYLEVSNRSLHKEVPAASARESAKF
jgi:hypothetical protein